MGVLQVPMWCCQFKLRFGTKALLGIEEKMHFPRASLSFWVGRCGRHHRFQGFEVSDRLWHISHHICKALQNDLEKDFVSPFLALVSLHSSEGFNFIMKNKFITLFFWNDFQTEWPPRRWIESRFTTEKKSVLQKSHNREFSWSLCSPIPNRSHATGMTSWEGHILALLVWTNWVSHNALFYNHARAAEMFTEFCSVMISFLELQGIYMIRCLNFLWLMECFVPSPHLDF